MKSLLIIVLLTLLSGLTSMANNHSTINQIEKTVKFRVVLDSSIHGKPFLIIFKSNFKVGSTATDQLEIEPVSNKGNTYIFILPDQKKHVYFSLVTLQAGKIVFILDNFHFEPADDIIINLKQMKQNNQFDISFAGKNSGKYRCQYEFSSAVRTAANLLKQDTTKKHLIYEETFCKVNAQLQVLEKYKSIISPFSFRLLKADIQSKSVVEPLQIFSARLSSVVKTKDSSKVHQFITEYAKMFTLSFSDVPDSVLSVSRYYPDYVLGKIRLDYLVDHKKIDYRQYFEEIIKISYKPVRDKVIVSFFVHNAERFYPILEELINRSFTIVEDKQCLIKLTDFKNATIGNKAFDFALQDNKGKTVRLSDYKGKIVFIDFWYTGCGACKKYYQYELREVEEKYIKNPDVVFITISVDESKEKWLKSITEGQYTSDKVINLYTNGESDKHEMIRFYNIPGYPQPLLIDRKGNIAKFKDPSLRNKVGLTKAIEELN